MPSNWRKSVSVVKHQHDRPNVEEQVSARACEGAEHVVQQGPVLVGRAKHVDVLGVEQGADEGQGVAPGERLGEDLRMRRDAQELVDDAVGQVPGIGRPPDVLEEAVGCGVFRRVRVGAVQQDVGVDDARHLTNP
jgi:hypothetical protein